MLSLIAWVRFRIYVAKSSLDRVMQQQIRLSVCDMRELCAYSDVYLFMSSGSSWTWVGLLWQRDREDAKPSVADWAMVCLLAAPWVQLSVSAGNGWPHNAMRHHWLMPVSCHFRDCKSAAGHESDSCKRRYNKTSVQSRHSQLVLIFLKSYLLAIGSASLACPHNAPQLPHSVLIRRACR